MLIFLPFIFSLSGCGPVDDTAVEATETPGTDNKEEDKGTESEDAQTSILDLLKEDAEFSQLVELAEKLDLSAKLDERLAENTNIQSLTFFAPTNEVFESLGETFTSLTDAEKAEVVLYHFLTKEVQLTDLAERQSLVTLHGDEVFIVKQESSFSINGPEGASFYELLGTGSNGIVYKIDGLLFPDKWLNTYQALKKRYRYSSLVKLLDDNGLSQEIASKEQITLFAPNDEALEANSSFLGGLSNPSTEIPNILKYHAFEAKLDIQSFEETNAFNSIALTTGSVPQTDQLFIAKSDIAGTRVNGQYELKGKEIITSNGVIHDIGGVLLPDAYLMLNQVISKRYYLSQLANVATLEPELAQLLANPDASLTVFAINNDIIQAAAAQDPEFTSKLSSIISLHIAKAKLASNQLPSSIPTLLPADQSGTNFVPVAATAATDSAPATLTGPGNQTAAKIVLGDIVARNGNLHVIDNMLLPPLGEQ